MYNLLYISIAYYVDTRVKKERRLPVLQIHLKVSALKAAGPLYFDLCRRCLPCVLLFMSDQNASNALFFLMTILFVCEIDPVSL